VESFERTLLKGEVPGFATGFDHPLSCERPFKCQHHLIQELECDKELISLTVLTSGSGLFLKPHIDLSNSANTLFRE
jgi:hypothetical protein